MYFHFHVQHLIQQFGYPGVFGILVLEMIGLPFPAETTLTISGIEWSNGTFAIIPILLVAILGNIIGSSIAYGLGRFLGRGVIVHYGKRVGITEKRLEIAEAKFLKYRRSVIFGAKFIAGIRVLVPYLAGINRMSFAKFTLYNSISAFIWVTAFVFLGKYLGKGWVRYHKMFNHILLPTLLLLIIIVIISLYYRKNKIKE